MLFWIVLLKLLVSLRELFPLEEKLSEPFIDLFAIKEVIFFEKL